MKKGIAFISISIMALLPFFLAAFPPEEGRANLWDIYNRVLKPAKYVDLTHAFNPMIPVWPGFGNATFKPAKASQDYPGYAKKGDPFQYREHGFVATAYILPTDQYGTQLDPPAHFYPFGATISDLPATYSIRPLVIIDIHEKVKKDPGYHAAVEDIKTWEAKNGTIPEGSVVAIRSDWYKRWHETERFATKPFPGIKLETLKYLHLKKKILFHGHEPLDTDTTPNLEGENWLLKNNFCQAEGMMNLDKVPEKGALIIIGFAKPEGGTGGYARYIAVCPQGWKYGKSIAEVPGAPLLKHPFPLKRDKHGVLRPTPPGKKNKEGNKK
jgi:kynurenine formamidase